VLEQTDIMRDQVARQLERARLAARSTVIGTLIDVPPVVTALASEGADACIGASIDGLGR